ncbi:MAG: hypothetical protein PHW43_09955 [Syntrophales bacterium]|nr:hypothetical protein [Syntrophales bacterium]
MDEQTRSKIDRKLVKYLLGRDMRVGSISDIKRNLGNSAKELDIPPAELLQYAKLTIQEMVDDQLKALK